MELYLSRRPLLIAQLCTLVVWESGDTRLRTSCSRACSTGCGCCAFNASMFATSVWRHSLRGNLSSCCRTRSAKLPFFGFFASVCRSERSSARLGAVTPSTRSRNQSQALWDTHLLSRACVTLTRSLSMLPNRHPSTPATCCTSRCTLMHAREVKGREPVRTGKRELAELVRECGRQRLLERILVGLGATQVLQHNLHTGSGEFSSHRRIFDSPWNRLAQERGVSSWAAAPHGRLSSRA